MNIFDEVDVMIESEKEQRRQERMAQCGKFYIVEVGGNGQVKLFQNQCRDPRCPRCRHIRAYKIKARIENLVEGGAKLKIVQMPKEEATTFLRQYDKSMFLRIPQVDGSDLIFIDTEDEVGKELNAELMYQIQWESAVTQVKGRNLSGNLGKASPLANKAEIVVEIQQMQVDNPQLATEAAIEAIDQTRDTSYPTSKEELQAIINKRAERFREIYKEKGGTILEVKQSKVKIRSFNLFHTFKNEVFNRKNLDDVEARYNLLLSEYSVSS